MTVANLAFAIVQTNKNEPDRVLVVIFEGGSYRIPGSWI